MLTYFLPGFNSYRIRTKQIQSGSTFLIASVQNMSTNEDYSFAFNPGQWNYNECESMVDISFNLTAALNVNVGDEYRMTLAPAITSSTIPFTVYSPVWNGSLQVFASQSIDKPAYKNQIPISNDGEDQIPCEISRQSENEYIIYESGCPQPGPPTTTTTSTTSTTTQAP